MPELPEVETVVRDLRAAGFEGAQVADIAVLRPSVLHDRLSPDAFCRQLRGRVWHLIDRRGKYIRILLDDGHVLLIHLRMTGQFRLIPAANQAAVARGSGGGGRKQPPANPVITPQADPHDRLILRFTDGRALHFHDTRAFGSFRLIDAPDAPPLDRLGPEPLSRAFSADWLALALRKHRRMLKPLLLDQTFLAGLGNIYVDEALWAAQLHPTRLAQTLSVAEARRLHRSIRAVLRHAVVEGGTTLGTGATHFFSLSGRRGDNAHNLRVFRRHGEACPRCGAILARAKLAQRGTHWCPACQTVD